MLSAPSGAEPSTRPLADPSLKFDAWMAALADALRNVPVVLPQLQTAPASVPTSTEEVRLMPFLRGLASLLCAHLPAFCVTTLPLRFAFASSAVCCTH